MRDDILITDLPARIAGGFTPSRGVGEGWIPVTWETADCQGVGLAAGAGSGARELTLDLGLSGRHILHLALGAKTGLRVWLDGEPGYREFVTQHGTGGLQECRLHTADLTGRKVHIALKDDLRAQPAMLAYIRAEPCAASHRSTRNLIATNDGASWVAYDGIDSVRDVARYFAPFRDSDFFRILWGPVGADVTSCHPTKVGTFHFGCPPAQAWGSRERLHAANIERTRKMCEGILAAAVANAREVGIEIHFYIRMEGFYLPFPSEQVCTSRFFLDHPQWRCRDEFGDEIMRMSYAFPAVQDHMLEYFKELLEYRPDGLCFAFNRSLPMMICEEPVLAEFERRQGRRPRLPEEVDGEGMIEARTALMTRFIERVKALLDPHGLALSCIVKPDNTVNRTCGLDLPALVERGIFESICVHSGGHHAPGFQVHNSPFWKELRDSKRVRIYPYGWGGSYDHRETARFLQENVFGQQFAGGFFWDTENFFENPYNWHVIRQGGTSETLDGTISGKIPGPKITPLTRIQGVKLGRYNPVMSG